MKKTLLALAAIAASSAAFAQSSVTLYGVMDASVESVKANGSTVTRVSSDNLATSRIGFKGTEDFGGGLKANFALESALKADTGAQGNSARFFDRAAWVGIAGGFGDIRLGRIDTPIGDIAGNVLSAQAYDDLKIVGTRAGDAHRRADNAITYFLPAIVPGLTASLQYSTAIGNSSSFVGADKKTAGAEVSGTTSNNYGKAYGLAVKYVAGPLSAGLGYEYARDELASTTTAPTIAGNQKANAALGYAAYDFGVAKVTAYYDVETSLQNLTTASKARRLSVTGAKVALPVAPNFTVIAGASVARNISQSGVIDADVQIVTVKAIYDLSKRTAVYGMFTNVNNDTSSTASVDNATAGFSAADHKTARGLAVGIKHSF
ncbi:porin [Aquabacterium sp.]|uniref:porin n=1 Tax=Aquabacterium sp. TaxID=1872578 RepID=UPI0035B228A7